MARMYPEALPEEGVSEAERRVFAALRDGLGPEDVVLTQVAWLSPDAGGRPREGEADVVVAHPAWGVLVLEVKGGVVEYDPSRGWTSNGVPIKDPVGQARASAHALARRLQEAPATRSYAFPFGHGVWFPDGDAARLPPRPDAPDAIVLDAGDLADPEPAIERVYAWWHLDGERRGPGCEGLDALVGLLAPSWVVRPLLGAAIRREAAEHQRLTEQQFAILRLLGRRPRALVSGCAGSGKTLLAVEKARRLAADGFTVLFTCFNRNLAALVRASLEGTGVEVVHFHELCYVLGREAGVDLPAEEVPGMPASYFDEQLPEALAVAAGRLGPRYDAIVVDEGQDFQDVWWIPLMELLRDPECGILYVFFDERQDLYRRPRAWPLQDEPFELTTDCRSTRALHRLLCDTLPGALDGTECLGGEGRPAERVVVGSVEAERKALRQLLHRLVYEERVAPADLVVLTPRARGKSHWQQGERLGNLRLTWATAVTPGEVQVSTIHSFKGLERPVVVLSELDHLHRGREAELLYVAGSRATSHLIELWPTGGAPGPAPN